MRQEILLLLAFLKDKLSLILIFSINTAIIVLFFNLSLNSNEWLYPCSISAAIFAPYMFVRYSAYRKLMRMVGISEVNIPDEIYTNKEYIRKINSTLIKIHRNYNIRLNEEMQRNVEFRRFIAQFIHAMKTPVTVINLAVNQSEECCLNDIIKDISEENQRQMDMLNNVLDYLRINEFNTDYSPEAVDLNAELTRIINSKKRSFIYNNIRPNLIADSTKHAEVLTDSKWNAVMLEQLISNAIKYSNAADEMKKIDFNIEVMDKKAILSIRDYGIGIPEQDIPKLTDPFFTGQNGRKRKNASGIGLYIVKLISQSLGHEVIIESQVGEGTQVSIIYHNRNLSKM